MKKDSHFFSCKNPSHSQPRVPFSVFRKHLGSFSGEKLFVGGSWCELPCRGCFCCTHANGEQRNRPSGTEDRLAVSQLAVAKCTRLLQTFVRFLGTFPSYLVFDNKKILLVLCFFWFHLSFTWLRFCWCFLSSAFISVVSSLTVIQ